MEEKTNEIQQKVNTIKVRVTFVEDLLGSQPSNKNLYRDFIGSKAPNPDTVEDEVAAIGVDAVVEKGMTVFPRMEDGTPFMYDYQVKGFFKDTVGGLRKVPGTESSKVKAYKKEIDKLIFPYPRKIPIKVNGEIGVNERSLRASTPQGERTSLTCSELSPAGSTMEFSIAYFLPQHEALIRECLDYAIFSGFGQWRNSGAGRAYWEELDEAGNVIGGNKP